MLTYLIKIIKSISLLFAAPIAAYDPTISTIELSADNFRNLPQPKYRIGQTVQQVFIPGVLDEPEDEDKKFCSVGCIVGIVWNNPYVWAQGWSYAVLWSLVDSEFKQYPQFEFEHETDLFAIS